MKILLIDNGTTYLSEIEKLLIDEVFEVITYSQINKVKHEHFKAIILSGGHDFPVIGNEKKLKHEIHLIQNFKKPILGICFGCELIASVFGAKLKKLSIMEHGTIAIHVTERNQIFRGISKFKVFESHRWIIQEPGNNLKVMAKSKDGIEAVKHITLPIYGVQFHPEMFTKETEGDNIFRNFLKIVQHNKE